MLLFLFNGSLGYQLSQNVLDRYSQNFQDRYKKGRHDQSDFHFGDRLRGVAMVANF